MKVSQVLGALLFPALAILYATYALWEQFTGPYRQVTTNYALLLAVPVLALSAVVAIRTLVGAAAARAEAREAAREPGRLRDSEAPGPGLDREKAVRLTLLVALGFLLVVSLPWVGYLAGFFGFVVLALLVMGTRSPLAILAIAVGTAAIVHYVFVVLLQLPFPAGFLEGVLPGT